MKTQRFVMTAVAVAMGASLAAFAAEYDAAPVKVVPAETIYVVPPQGTFHGVYTSEKDAALLSSAIKALQADKSTNKAFLTIVATRGELIVNGTVQDVGQGTRIETKLKALNGGTKVYAWFDNMSGSSE